jgi:hypothetical protein
MLQFHCGWYCFHAQLSYSKRRIQCIASENVRPSGIRFAPDAFELRNHSDCPRRVEIQNEGLWRGTIPSWQLIFPNRTFCPLHTLMPCLDTIHGFVGLVFARVRNDKWVLERDD